jgi:hypothetical protein
MLGLGAWKHKIVRGSPVAGSRPGDWPADHLSRPSGVDQASGGGATVVANPVRATSYGFMAGTCRAVANMRFAGMDV